MLITWLLLGFATGLMVGAFLDDIIKWAKKAFDRLSSAIRKVWVYIRRVPGGIKKMIEYIENGKLIREPEIEEVSWEEIEERHRNGDIDDETFNALKAGRDKKIAELDRDR